MDIVIKDLKLESNNIFIAFIISFLILAIFSFSFEEPFLPSIIWLAFIFSGTICIQSSFSEKEKLTALLLSPIPWFAIFLGKVFYAFILLLFIEGFTLLLSYVLFNFLFHTYQLFILIISSAFGFALSGAFISAISLNAKNKLIYPILLLPILFPILILSLSATNKILDGKMITLEFEALLLYIVLFLLLPYLLFEKLMRR
ncbi:MAG: hypothetical protein AB1779_04115 [Candidatus Thermoplasmatota archaeon]